MDREIEKMGLKEKRRIVTGCVGHDSESLPLEICLI